MRHKYLSQINTLKILKKDFLLKIQPPFTQNYHSVGDYKKKIVKTHQKKKNQLKNFKKFIYIKKIS